MTNPLALNAPASNKSTNELGRVMLYGKPKTRKTWWAGTAGETHRVTILDGENGTGILSNLPAEQQANVQRIPLAGQVAKPAMAIFCSLLFKKQAFLWDMDEEREIMPQHIRPEGNYIDVDLKRLTRDDVLVIDSWTKIASDSGLQYMVDNKIDPFSGKKKEFDFYGFQDLVLDAIIAAFNCVPCHIILIGHEQYYTHKVKEGMLTKEINRTQVISSTGKHSQKIPAFVSDLLWFECDMSGETKIFTGSTQHRDGGCRNITPAEKMFSVWKWKDFCEEANIAPAEQPEHPYPSGFQYIKGQDIINMMAGNQPTAQQGVIQGG